MSEIFGVVGAGTMGNGIAQVAARAGFKVVMRDIAPEFLTRGLSAIDKSLQRDIEKERLSTGEKQSIVGRIQTTTDLSDLRDAFIIVEAVTEDLSVKSDVFKTLDDIAGADAILASNTSAISITKLGAVTRRPDKVIGMHFMNPVPVMKLVEIIRGLPTSQATYDTVVELAQRFGKTTVSARDIPGFIVNRMMMPL